MKGYKVFNQNWICREKQYSCPGIFKQKGELRLCKNGIHFCRKLSDCFNYYLFDSKNKVAEIETLGKVIGDEIQRKYCTSKIKIIRELSWNEVLDLVNTGRDNTGFSNTGNQNSGCHNSGCNNSSSYNSGSYNSGFRNSGHGNSGNYNTGHYNAGNYNTGHYNSGSYNVGNYNSGNCNIGNYNIGNHNSGNYNIGDRSFGYFNTKENKVNFFNKQSDWTYKDWEESNARWILSRMESGPLYWTPNHEMSKEEKEKYPEYKTTKGFLRHREKEELYLLRQEWWGNLPEEDKKAILNLPNFDAKIFKEITGIDITIENKIKNDTIYLYKIEK